MKLFVLLAIAFGCAEAFMPVPRPAVAVHSVAVSPAAAITMTSVNKKAKAANRKMKSSRAAAKRFKVTATGKLLRHYAGKAHLLRRKRPQHKAHLRRVGQVNDAELDTYQRMLLVFPKKR